MERRRPGSGSGSGSGSGTGTQTVPTYYSFTVWGASGPGSGDVTWSGAADHLAINASGDVAPVTITGDLSVVAGWTIGPLAARDVSARAGKSVGAVTAGRDVLEVTASDGGVASVTAGDDVGQVWAAKSVGPVTAADQVLSVQASESVGAVTAGSWIGSVTAFLDVGGPVTAPYIGGAYAPGAGDDYQLWQAAPAGGGVPAGTWAR